MYVNQVRDLEESKRAHEDFKLSEIPSMDLGKVEEGLECKSSVWSLGNCSLLLSLSLVTERQQNTTGELIRFAFVFNGKKNISLNHMYLSNCSFRGS